MTQATPGPHAAGQPRSQPSRLQSPGTRGQGGSTRTDQPEAHPVNLAFEAAQGWGKKHFQGAPPGGQGRCLGDLPEPQNQRVFTISTPCPGSRSHGCLAEGAQVCLNQGPCSFHMPLRTPAATAQPGWEETPPGGLRGCCQLGLTSRRTRVGVPWPSPPHPPTRRLQGRSGTWGDAARPQRARTSQLLFPAQLHLLLVHGGVNGPEVGHDGQEVLEVDLVGQATGPLAQVPTGAERGTLAACEHGILSFHLRRFREQGPCGPTLHPRWPS